MKINGFHIPLKDNDSGDGKVVDADALKAAWTERDTAAQPDRWASFYKTLGESIAIKGVWYPIFEAGMTAFWQIKQYQYDKYAPTLVLDMVFDRVRAGHEVDPNDYTAVKGMLSEFLAEQTSLDHDRGAIMWRDAAKGPGAKIYLNPFLRAKWTVQSDD